MGLALARSYWFPSQPAAVEVFPATLEWEFSAQDRIISSVIVDGNRVFFRTSNAIFALNALSGEVLWEARSRGSCQRTVDPVAAHGVVLVPEVDSGLAAFSATDGRLLWRKGPPRTEPLQTELQVSDASPDWPGQPHGIDIAEVTFDAERAYVARSNWLLATYDLFDGELSWAVRVPDRASLHLAAWESGLFMSAGGLLYTYDPSDGTLLDELELASAIGPILREGEILYLVAVAPEKKLLAIHVGSRELLCSQAAPAAVPGDLNSLMFSQGLLYFSGERVAAYATKAGQLLWQTDPGGPYGRAELLDRSIYVRERGPQLDVLDAANGEKRGALRIQANDPLGCLSTRNPGSAQGLLIVPFGDERLLAYRPTP
jgi:outer membrane protein assembly factor BamB